LTYQDEVLADGSLRRSFSDGRHEWRRRLPDGRVEWQDSQGYAGVDELLGDGIIKRTFNNGQVIYAREQGYGRTLWQGGKVLTVNQTSFGGRAGMILASMGAGFLLGSLVPPPEFLSPEEEEMLRQKRCNNSRPARGAMAALAAAATPIGIAAIMESSMSLSNRDRNLTAAIWAILMSETSDDRDDNHRIS
jgi:hypothetical protein